MAFTLEFHDVEHSVIANFGIHHVSQPVFKILEGESESSRGNVSTRVNIPQIRLIISNFAGTLKTTCYFIQ